MKKSLFTLVFAVVCAAAIFAQENPETAARGGGGTPPQESAPQEAAPSIPGWPGEVKLPMGVLNIHGLLTTGVRARSVKQESGLYEGVSPQVPPNGGNSAAVKGGFWEVEAINPTWTDNRFDLHLDYKFLNYGALTTMRFRTWAPNVFTDIDYMDVMDPDLRYAFVWGKFMQDKLKVSLGKVPDMVLLVPDTKVWQTDGPGERFEFTEDDKTYEPISMRVEFKPVPQLNVGFQYFFVQPYGTDKWGDWTEDFAESEVWKEIAFAARWQGDLFDASAAVRFDSDADPLNKYEGKTYLSGYYGDSAMLDQKYLINFQGPRYKHIAELYAPAVYDPTTWQETAPPKLLGFGGAARVFFGVNVKAVKNFDIQAQAGLYNLGAWDKFGYGRANELVKYNNLLDVKGLGVGLAMSQEFYGSDVFTDDMENSPFLTFAPEVTWKFFDQQIVAITAGLSGAVGFSPDVLDSYTRIKPSVNLQLAMFIVDLYYEFEYTDYTDKVTGRYGSAITPETKHTIGLGCMLMF